MSLNNDLALSSDAQWGSNEEAFDDQARRIAPKFIFDNHIQVLLIVTLMPS